MSDTSPRVPTAIYQSFETISNPANVAPRLAALRQRMADERLDAFLVPLSDTHRGESLPESERRLAHVTGFTGSAGLALIARDKAALLVDGRYTIQAPAQTDTNLVDVLPVPATRPAQWLKDHLPVRARIGYNPWLHTIGEISKWRDELASHAELVTTGDLVADIWENRPAPPMGSVELLGHNRAGRTASDKIADIQQQLTNEGADTLVLNVPESICWLFNMRGRDVPNTPVVLSFAIVPATGTPTLFVAPEKLTDEQREKLSAFATVEPMDAFAPAVEKLKAQGRKIWLDPTTCPALVGADPKGTGFVTIEKADPISMAKATKNEAELAGMREAQRLDSIAMAKFLRWFDEHAPKGNLTEIDIACALETFRREEETLFDISFDTISASGPHGAICHYRVNTQSNRRLQPGELMLVDSGGQYLSGTTDITRTMFCGSATPEHKDRFTRVLKGMIAISTLQFPEGTNGAQIDVLARHPLWQVGLNYDHGTGHGVGAGLSVHEGPAGIAARYLVPLKAGMILSNEPGYYKEGDYGIRIENLVHVIPSPDKPGFLAFETLTLTPIDTRLIDASLLNRQETDWLNAYHERVRSEVGPLLQGADREWLTRATAPI
ncbi:MAG TPA: aminopeptidase P family protein [Devosia sp.]|nr:aminopeptidase P family protein [Devosia sp.]